MNVTSVTTPTHMLSPFSPAMPVLLSGVAHPRDPLPRGGQKFSSCLHGPHYSAHPYRG